MLYTQKRNILKNILIISFLFSSISITFTYLILRDLIPLFNNYLRSENSLFLPFLPYSNILWFLPEEVQIIQFSTGHLIDIIIFMNIIAIVERSGYYYFIRVCLNENNLDTYQLGSKEELYTISEEPIIFFGVKGESSCIFNINPLIIKFKKKTRLNERFKVSYGHLRKENNINYLIRNKLLPRTSFTKRYQNFQVSCYHSSFEEFFNNFSSNYFLYPQIKSTINSTSFFQQEG